MKTYKPKTIMEAIEELETFLDADLPSKIFPMERIMDQTLFREDFFETKGEVEEYIRGHFNILKEQVKQLETKNETFK